MFYSPPFPILSFHRGLSAKLRAGRYRKRRSPEQEPKGFIVALVLGVAFIILVMVFKG